MELSPYDSNGLADDGSSLKKMHRAISMKMVKMTEFWGVSSSDNKSVRTALSPNRKNSEAIHRIAEVDDEGG